MGLRRSPRRIPDGNVPVSLAIWPASDGDTHRDETTTAAVAICRQVVRETRERERGAWAGEWRARRSQKKRRRESISRRVSRRTAHHHHVHIMSSCVRARARGRNLRGALCREATRANRGAPRGRAAGAAAVGSSGVHVLASFERGGTGQRRACGRGRHVDASRPDKSGPCHVFMCAAAFRSSAREAVWSVRSDTLIITRRSTYRFCIKNSSTTTGD